MTTYDGGDLSVSSIYSGFDEWSSLSFCISVKGMTVTGDLELYSCAVGMGQNNPLSPLLQGDIWMSVNIYNSTNKEDVVHNFILTIMH